jgi:hypothetical protein
MRNTIALIKSHVRFTNHEVFLIIGYAFLVGFLFSFTQWGDADGVFSWIIGLSNLIYYSALSFIVILTTIFFQKLVGAHIGILPTFQLTWGYVIVPLLIAFLTNGKIIMFFPPGYITTESLRNMMGRNRYREAFSDFLRIGLTAIFICVVLGTFFSLKFIPTQLIPIKEIFFFYAFYSLIPIDIIFSWNTKNPTISNAMSILYPSRSIYIFTIVFVALAYILSLTQTFFFTLLLSLLISFVAGLMWFLFKE